jgi:hypothetical protein
MHFLRVSKGFEGMLAIDHVGKSGGIALLWMGAREVMIHNYSGRHINAIVKLVDTDYSWKLTVFYGHPNQVHREAS